MTIGASVQASCITDLASLENSRVSGLLSSWDQLMATDHASTLYQGTEWCMEWYRNYNDTFTPFLLAIEADGLLVGVVPLAIERTTGRLTFATDNMADYRDVVSRPEYREAVVAELLRLYEAGSFPNTFWLGPVQPESNTIDILTKLTKQSSKLRTMNRAHECWRLSFSDPATALKASTKKSVRRNVNYYERRGPLVLQRLKDIHEWNNIKLEFFNQHSLRQLSVGRPTSFDVERKRRFYDDLIRHHPEFAHIAVLRAGGRFVAGHYGYLWRNVLHWGASTFDPREEKHSPGQVLVAMLLRHAAEERIQAVDFTLGTEDFKARFGNESVMLRSVEIYGKPAAYFRRKLRDQVVTRSKSAVHQLAGPQGWNAIKRLASDRALKPTRAKNLIFSANLDHASLSEHSTPPHEGFTFRTNEIEDLLKCADSSPETLRQLSRAVKTTSDLNEERRRLHTILMNGDLVAWGWSSVEHHSLVISETYVVAPDRHHDLDRLFLYNILNERLDDASCTVHVVCGHHNIHLQKALKQMGFEIAGQNRNAEL